MKAASGIAHIAALLLVACATAQSVDSSSAPAGSGMDAGHRRDSGTTQSGEGGSPDNGGAGGEPSTSSGGTDEGSGGSGAGGAVDSGGAGGRTQGGATGGIAGTSSGGSGGSGGTTSNGGSTQGGGGSTQGGGGTCSTGQKVCGGACVTQTPMNGCSATSCTACPIPAPANGLQMCDAQGQCNFECLSGYQKNGASCTMGNGGAGGAGGSGSGGAPSMCGSDTCHKCLLNLIGCCNKQGDRCMCVLPNQTDQCGP